MSTQDPEIPGNDNHEEGDICSICRCEFQPTSQSVTTPCNHKFHFQCFMDMTNNSPLCAVCRSPLRQEDTIEFSTEVNNLSSNLISVIRDRINSQFEENDDDDDEDYNIEDSLFSACENGDLSTVRDIIEDQSDDDDDDIKHCEDSECNTLLHAATLSNNQGLLRYLLIDLQLPLDRHNIYRMTALHNATMARHKDMVRMLINHGISINQQDVSGRTPLMIACQNNDKEICRLLLDHNASIRSFDSNGENVLHYCTRSKFAPILKVLLEHQPSNPFINSMNIFGDTPLHVACSSGSTTCVRYLIEDGANASLKNKAGKKAEEIIGQRDANRSRILLLLRDT